MAHAVALGAQVVEVLPVGEGRCRRHGADTDAIALQARHLVRVVRHELDRAHAQVTQHLGGGGVAAGVGRQPQRDVGVEGVHTLLLQRVGAELVDEPDAAPLMVGGVDEDPAATGTDRLHGGAQLRPAVAAQGGQDVAGQAGGVDSGEDLLAVSDAAAHQCEVLGAVDPAAQGVGGELPVRGGQVRRDDLLDELLVQPPVALQVTDRDHGHGVGVGELTQLVPPRHGAVVVDDLHEDPHGPVARQAHEVDGGLRVTAAREDPALACPQGEDVSGADEVVGS